MLKANTILSGLESCICIYVSRMQCTQFIIATEQTKCTNECDDLFVSVPDNFESDFVYVRDTNGQFVNYQTFSIQWMSRLLLLLLLSATQLISIVNLWKWWIKMPHDTDNVEQMKCKVGVGRWMVTMMPVRIHWNHTVVGFVLFFLPSFD